MACAWCAAQTLLLTRRPTSYHHLPATASSGKCFINTFTKVHELKAVLQTQPSRSASAGDQTLAPAESRRRLKPAPWISTHGELFLAENTRCTDYEKTESNIACLVSICSRALCACTPLRNDGRIHLHHLCRPLGSSRPLLRL